MSMRIKGMKLISIILIMALLIGLTPMQAFATEKHDKVITGKFSFTTAPDGEIVTDTYNYCDNYFDYDSSVYSSRLAAMSMALALSTMEDKGDSQVKAVYKGIGFKDVKTEDMTVTPTANTVGTAIAHKKINGREVISVVIRGANYGKEWCNNLIVGSKGDAQGFAAAAKKVDSRLKAYIKEKKLKNVKIWMTGYSRGGSLADLVGVKINKNPGSYSTTTKDLYVYVYEAPSVSSDKTVYKNMFAIRNKNDVLNYVYPESWGLYKNTVDVWIGPDVKVQTVKIDIINSEQKIFVVDEMSGEDTVKWFVDWLEKELPRDRWSGDFENAVVTLIDMIMSKDSEELSEIIGYFKDVLMNGFSGEDKSLFNFVMFYVMGGLMNHNSDILYQDFSEEFCSILDKLTKDTDMPISEQEYETLKGLIYPLFRVLGPIIVKDYRCRNVDGAITVILPEDFDDPSYDPKEDFWYEMYEKTKDPSEDEDEKEAEKGRSDGWNKGFEDGELDYNAGTYMEHYNPEPEDTTGLTQIYIDNYKDSYPQGYEAAFEEPEPTPTDAEQAERDAEDNGHQDGFYDGERGADQYKKSYNDDPYRGEAEELSQEYIDKYLEVYPEGYENGFADGLDRFYDYWLVHLGTFGVNLSNIISMHYPQVNWQIVKAMAEKECIVSFDLNGHGKPITAVRVNAGSKVKAPAKPTESGWSFDGWYLDQKCTKAFNFGTKIVSDITLYAKWTKVVTLFRLYNPNSGEHFYTASAAERDNLVKAGWNSEGSAWTSPIKSNTPVYRLYNPNAGDHHYTMSKAEKENLVKAGWKDEGIGWYSDDAKTKPVYRAYNPNAVAGAHHFTVSKAEIETLVKAGWKDEGIAFYSK